MKERSFYDNIHTLGRVTVVLALLCFMAVPFGLSIINGVPLDLANAIKSGMPVLITLGIAGICENLSFMPIIGSGALYMACVTGNVSNMKVPAAANAMDLAGCTPGSQEGDVISIIAVAASTFVTTIIVLLPAFQNMIPALFGALLFPQIAKAPKQAIVPILIPVALILLVGRQFFSDNQSYIMVGIIVLSALYSYGLFKKKLI